MHNLDHEMEFHQDNIHSGLYKQAQTLENIQSVQYVLHFFVFFY